MERPHLASSSERYPLDGQSLRLSHEHDEPPSSASLREGLHLASLAEKKRLWWRNAIINTLFIASWFFFSTMLSLYNKWMFSPAYLGFPAPVFVTTMHMFIQFFLAATLRTFWPRKFKPQYNPKPKDYGTKVVPTAIATSLDIGLSNLSLKTITLSFFTMCKSSSLIFVLMFAFLFRLEAFSWKLIGVITLIFSGVVLMVATEAHFVLEGLILVLTASALGGLRWSLTQVLLKNKKMGLDNPAATIFWLAPSMGATLAIVSMALEHWPTIFRSKFFDGVWKTFETILFLTLPGVIAFCMVISEFYIILRAGVVPMSIAGIAKEVSTIIISSWFFGDHITLVNGIGVAITVCGIALFTHHKYRKSLDSTVPLDAHGNPILEDDEMMTMSDNTGYGARAEETIRLTSTHDGDLDNEIDEERVRQSADDTPADRRSTAGFQWESGQTGHARNERDVVERGTGLGTPDVQKAWNG